MNKLIACLSCCAVLLVTAACQRHHSIICIRFTDLSDNSYRYERGHLDGTTFSPESVFTGKYSDPGTTRAQVAPISGKFVTPTFMLRTRGMTDVPHSSETYTVDSTVYVIVGPE